MVEKKVSGLAVLELAADSLRQRFAQGNEIALEPPVDIVIADDSDGHRRKRGYMTYRALFPLKFGNTDVMLILGTKTGDYPGDAVAGDLGIVRLGKPDEADKALREVSDLSHTLVVAMQDGRLVPVPEEGPSRVFWTGWMAGLEQYKCDSPQLSADLIDTATLQSVVTAQAAYDSYAGEFLADQVHHFLEVREA
jgi:hypothetical protein